MAKKNFFFVCTGKDCKKKGARELCKAVKENKSFRLVKTKCLDSCKKAPCLILHEALYYNMNKEKLNDLLT